MLAWHQIKPWWLSTSTQYNSSAKHTDMTRQICHLFENSPPEQHTRPFQVKPPPEALGNVDVQMLQFDTSKYLTTMCILDKMPKHWQYAKEPTSNTLESKHGTTPYIQSGAVSSIKTPATSSPKLNLKIHRAVWNFFHTYQFLIWPGSKVQLCSICSLTEWISTRRWSQVKEKIKWQQCYPEMPDNSPIPTSSSVTMNNVICRPKCSAKSLTSIRYNYH